jgi:hypothetical protein
MITGSSSASLRPGSSGYNAREPAAAVLRQLGVPQVWAATAALTELQSRLMAYKDASKLAGGYATAGTKSLAPDMAAHLTQVLRRMTC